MSTTPRQHAISSVSSSQHLQADWRTGAALTEVFGCKVFNDTIQRRRLKPKTYRSLRKTIETGASLGPDVAEDVADAMKDWAVEHGATHFTHWFQPMTGLTAEKHDSFLSPVVEGGAIHAFTGNELIKGEPDASSFPSGGSRATFEARGYTAWDPSSPAFLRETKFGATLYIPTAFCSWTGESLDTKTPLLRSCAALDTQARRLLELIDEKVEHIMATVGPEQEYFLIDRELYKLRPDLRSGGRTLFGAKPPKGQELEDHYFAATPERVLNFMMDLEHQLWQLGVPLKTRHNEVAPHQFELAPMYENVSTAVDHNMLTMEMLENVAGHHGFKCLLHEKPFAGVNGSGKHNNWSMCDENGSNLLEPGRTPHQNMRFILCLTAIISAVDKHQDLIRATYASAGNDHRLGANEAPPAILSIFLGSELQEIVDALVKGDGLRSHEREELRLGVSSLPPLPRDTSDRNRTSPFAFTGNKFELRACGSSQTIAYVNTVINTIVAEAFDHLATCIDERLQGGETLELAVQGVVQETLAKHQRILFSGDNYDQSWTDEAERRGLSNLRTTPEALATLYSPGNVALFEKYAVLTDRELHSRSNVFYEAYNHRVAVEALSARQIASTSILPAALTHQGRLAASINATRSACPTLELRAQEELLSQVAGEINQLKAALDALGACLEQRLGFDGASHEAALHSRDGILPAMEAVRQHADSLEELVEDQLWPLPKYHELLFIH